MDNSAMNKALIGVQKCVLKATKDGTNTFFGGSRYATLDSILEAIRGPLTENGFALVQDATTGDMSVSVVTRLLHESGGELVSPPLTAPLKKEFTKTGVELPPSVQQIGSLVTYLRRYSLCPFLGVALDDDDDGNMASQAGTEGGGQKTEGGGAGEAVGNRQSAVGSEKAPHGAATNGQAGAGGRKSAYTGEALNTPEAVERHKAAAAGGAAGNGQPAIGGSGNSRTDAKAQSGDGKGGGVTANGANSANGNGQSGGERTEGEGKREAVGSGGRQEGKSQPVPQPDVMAFNTRLYDAMERDKITEAEITGYLNGTYGKPRIARPVLAGNLTIHNLGERIADALESGTDKEGKSNWETVVGRIRADRK